VRSIAAIVTVTLGTVTAAADPGTADRDAADADALAARGEFAAAAQKFRDAYREDRRPSLICNAGVAYYKAKELPRAHYYLGRCLGFTTSLDAGFVASVAKAIAAVSAKLEADKLPRLDLRPDPPTATIAIEGAGSPFDEPIEAGVVWLPRGAYTLRFHADGYTDRRIDVELHGSDVVAEDVTLVRAHDEPPPAAGSGSAAPVIEAPPPPPKPEPTMTVPRGRRAALVTTAATLAVAAAALASYGWAAHQASQAGDAQTPDAYADLKSSALGWQHASWVLGGLAGAGAIASGVLWYVATRTDETRSALRLDLGACATCIGVAVGGRF
jgi:hypothetical protein